MKNMKVIHTYSHNFLIILPGVTIIEVLEIYISCICMAEILQNGVLL